jgi:positive regulator of sigma E activity
MLGKELLDIVSELVKDILNALRDAIKQKDIFYFVALIIFIISFTAGVIFAFAMIIIFITFLTSALKDLLSTATVSFLVLKKGGRKNENQNMEERRKAER